MALSATKENNEEPSKSGMFIATGMKNGKQLDPETKVVIVSIQNRKNSGETADDSFKAVFENEQPDRVRYYGRSVTTTSLKKDEEIIKIKQKLSEQIEKLQGLVEEVQELQQLRHLMKVLIKNNPRQNLEDANGCIGSNLPCMIGSSSA
ncbi:uncharacterized protein LOC129890283 [Solanum dulcamara]|uniref:uncharacterized protein LOC129890283 n=1 Tax=Solanum dulcamara TaxID=45834 RepID=UPI002485C00B|nr:uncharacterized protein LOC129890283 [Solanum dulcamara]